jgi:hypothetical protein
MARMPGREMRFALRVAVFARCVPLLMRLRLDRVERLLRHRPVPDPKVDPERRAWIVEAVLIRGARLVGRGCLTRGLTRWYFLDAPGKEVALVFGVGHPDADSASFEGHCWVAVDGEPYRERTEPTEVFTETVRLLRAPAAVR